MTATHDEPPRPRPWPVLRPGDDGRADPRGDGGALPRGRLERSQRPHRGWHRPPGHPAELRVGHRARRRRDGNAQPGDPRHHQRLCAARRGGGLRLALRPGRPVLAVQPGRNDENYLRGMQETDSAGAVSFTSIFPACYPGRWPHIHFKVYASVAEATGGAGPLATSQGALPEDVCNQAYGADGYEQSVTNLTQVSLEADNVFGDGASQQLASVTCSVDDGFVVELSVPV